MMACRIFFFFYPIIKSGRVKVVYWLWSVLETGGKIYCRLSVKYYDEELKSTCFGKFGMLFSRTFQIGKVVIG